MRPAAPTGVRIDRLGLDEQLIGLGLAADGTLEVPDDPDRVGWFIGGGRPGGTGPTVLAGHVDSTTGPAVFARLTELRVSDTVVVSSADGRSTRYRVTRAIDVPKAQFPTEAVFGASPTDELRLITCTGVWDRGARSLRDNRVVFAVPV